MKIYVISGKGYGKTPLSAFDRALMDTGVYNYNLIRLSSIIPKGSMVEEIKKFNAPENQYGHKLYVVRAEIRSNHPRYFIGAGIGWYQLGDRRGVFVEHEVIARDEKSAKEDLSQKIIYSLSDLCEFRNFPFDRKKARIKLSVCEIKDKKEAGCALVLAVYKAEGWK